MADEGGKSSFSTFWRKGKAKLKRESSTESKGNSEY